MVTESKTLQNERLQRLAAPAYFVAALLMITPLGDFLSGARPWRPSALDWRITSTGFLAGFLLTPLLGMLLATGVAAARGNQRLLRVLGIASLVAASVCALIIAGFILDVIQLNARIPDEQRRAFYEASIKAVLKYALVCAAAYLLGSRAYRMGRWSRERRAAAPRETIVIGGGATAEESAAN